ncbi:MAG TPA: SigB/SigF/SigG family RNA polymerase sigma factor [Myxococcota bacterium]
MAPVLTPNSPALPRLDAAARFERFQRTRDPAERDALVERHLPLARHLAHKYATGSDRDDVEQVASLGLIKAVERFDPSRGTAFTSFAVPTILGELKRYFRDLGWTVRVPRSLQELNARIDSVTEDLSAELGRAPTPEELAQACDVSVERVLEARSIDTAHFALSLDASADPQDDDPLARTLGGDDPGYARVERAADLDRLLGCLSDLEREVIRLRFREDMVQRDIGARLGISQMQVSRILRRAIASLQQHSG